MQTYKFKLDILNGVGAIVGVHLCEDILAEPIFVCTARNRKEAVKQMMHFYNYKTVLEEESKDTGELVFIARVKGVKDWVARHTLVVT